MLANIQSRHFIGFSCRIKKDPVLTFRGVHVYELAESSVPNEIVKKVNGSYAGTFLHIALDENGIGYLFDFKNKKLAGCIGPCDYILDWNKPLRPWRTIENRALELNFGSEPG